MAIKVPQQIERHPSSQEFHDILIKLGELHDCKQKDYGKTDDPFANIRSSAAFGVEPWRAVLVRMQDKWNRLQAFAINGDLANESVEDSLMDIAVYSVICLVLMGEDSNDRQDS